LLRGVTTINVGFVVPNAAASANEQMQGGAPLVGTSPGDRLGTGGRYELVERIGSGGMGAVWRAHDHKLGCDRAVKVLDARYSAVPDFVQRFQREAKATSSIAHPNIVAVLDTSEGDERPVFMVMELIEGRTLSQLVKGNGRLPWEQVRRIIDQIAAGLGAAHAQDVVHRDMKPGNCIVLPDGQVKILDFGIAHARDEARLTKVGEIIGTCSYMAPEQIRGQVDKRSDIYALGVLTFRLLTGRVPFSHREQDKVLLAHLTEPAPAPSSIVAGLPASVDELVLRMLAKQPHKRFDGMDELRHVLEGIDRGAVVAIDGPTAVPPSKSATSMFEDAPTRAVVREAVPVSLPETKDAPVRVSLNTAPAGSGTLAKLEAQTLEERLPGTVMLENAAHPLVATSSGTVVYGASDAPVGLGGSGGTVPTGMVGQGVGQGVDVGALVEVPGAGQRAMPPRVITVPTPVPRPLPGLAANVASAPPRVTRYAAPGEVDSSGGMMRGVGAALGGIALAVAVVTGWVVYKRHLASNPPPAAVPAAAVTAEGEVGATPDADAAALPGLPGEDADAAPSEDAKAADGGGPGAVEGSEVASDSSAPVVEAVGAGDGPAAEPSIGEPLASDANAKATKKRRTGKKTADDAQPEVPKTDPDPEPKPDPDAGKKKKSGDLRNPW
jgi:serine/threonine protein kinase